MAFTIPYELTQYFENKMGKEETREFVKFFENTAEAFEEKANGLAVQKKLELKDELTKELATKADIDILKADINMLDLKIEQSNKELKIYLKFLIVLMIIFIGFLNPVVS